MPRFPSKLIDRFEVANGTMGFAFERPAGFEFAAGQFMTITLPDPPYNDEKDNRRTFSIASPLSEGDLEGKEIICPLHGAVFDVTNGEVVEPTASEPLTRYNVRVSAEGIEVEV